MSAGFWGREHRRHHVDIERGTRYSHQVTHGVLEQLRHCRCDGRSGRREHAIVQSADGAAVAARAGLCVSQWASGGQRGRCHLRLIRQDGRKRGHWPVHQQRPSVLCSRWAACAAAAPAEVRGNRVALAKQVNYLAAALGNVHARVVLQVVQLHRRSVQNVQTARVISAACALVPQRCRRVLGPCDIGLREAAGRAEPAGRSWRIAADRIL
jgi:hypothetical protein